MISKREFIEVTMGVLYGMAPGHHLRFTKEIVDHIHNNWDGTLSKFESNKVHEYLRIDKGDDKIIYKFTEDILMSCQEFKWLNISQRKWDNGQRTLDDGFTIGCVVGHGSDGDVVSVETIADYDDFIDLILDFCEYNINNTQCCYSFHLTLKACINDIIEHNSYNAYKRMKSMKNLYLNNINIVNDNGVDFLTFNMGVTLDNKDIIFKHIINFGNLSLKNNTMVGFALDKLDWTFLKDLNNEFRKKLNRALPNNVIEEILKVILDFLTKHYTLSQDFTDKFNFFINNCNEELDIKYIYQCNKQQESIQQMQQQIIELSEMMKSLEERLSLLTAIPNSLIND